MNRTPGSNIETFKEWVDENPECPWITEGLQNAYKNTLSAEI